MTILFALLRWLLPCALLFGVLALELFAPERLAPLRNYAFDEMMRRAPRHYEPMPVTIIDIDEQSLQQLGQWPWSRDKLAGLSQAIFEHGALALGMDVMFAEGDRTSPARLVPEWSRHMAVEPLRDVALPDFDAMFAAAIAPHPVVAGFALFDGAEGADIQALRLPYGMVEKGSEAHDWLVRYDDAVTSLAIIEAAASGNGALNAVPGRDGVIRTVPLLLGYNDRMVAGLALETLRVAQGASTYVVSSEDTGITAVRVGNVDIPTDAHGHMWMHYTEFTPQRYVSAWEVMQPDFDRARLDGHIVLLGTSAAGLKDIRTTPLNAVTNGVEVHAQALEQMLLGHYVERPDWMRPLEWVLMLLAGGAIWLIVARGSPLVGGCCMMLAVAGALWGSWVGFTHYRWLVDPLTPSIVMVLLYMSETARRFIGSERERAQVRHAFSHYMSPAMVDRLARDPSNLVLGGQMRDMSVLFCDIRGFTGISEQYDAQELTAFINWFLTPMTDIILARRGTIDKYMGDCIMAFWNAPLDDADHVLHACQAALAMMAALDGLNAQRRGQAEENGTAFIPVAIGIGINSAECCVGNMGSDQRFDYSVLGDGVNLASRLEGQSKYYGVDIVIGPLTFAACGAMATLELDRICVKGKQEAVVVYALMGNETLAARHDWQEIAKANHRMLDAYRAQDWDVALWHLDALWHGAQEAGISLDRYAQLYQERIEAYIEQPPALEWDGVFEATSK